MSKQESSGEKEQEALLTFLPTQHGVPVRADCRHRASALQRSSKDTDLLFVMYLELPANAFLLQLVWVGAMPIIYGIKSSLLVCVPRTLPPLSCPPLQLPLPSSFLPQTLAISRHATHPVLPHMKRQDRSEVSAPLCRQTTSLWSYSLSVLRHSQVTTNSCLNFSIFKMSTIVVSIL